VRVLSTLNREELKPGNSVALHRHSHAIVGIVPAEADSSVQQLAATEKPDVTYADIGGMDVQKQEIKEAIELPLLQLDLYEQIGIDPPSGVLLYGPPGTGKTMLAKAVANQSDATFIRVVGSEFVQKYLGEGPRMVATCSGWLESRLRQSSSSMRSTLSVRSVLIVRQGQIGRCSVFCWNCSTRWTVLTRPPP